MSAQDRSPKLDELALFEKEIKKALSENRDSDPQLISPLKIDDLIFPSNLIQTEFPRSSSPTIFRLSHETANFFGPKITALLSKLGAIPQEIDINFAELDPHSLTQEVHLGIQTIRASSEKGISIPARLLEMARNNKDLFPHIRQIQLAAEQNHLNCRGLALSGGPDVEEEFYNEKAALQAVDYRRSIAEFAWATEVVKQKKPILGTCRGAQLINVLFGGTLKNVELQVDWKMVELTNSSIKEKLSRLLQNTSLPAYFYHHQACDKIAPGFEVAMHHQGIPEMIVSHNEYIMGIQIHAEQDDQGRYSKAIHIYRLFLEKALRDS